MPLLCVRWHPGLQNAAFRVAVCALLHPKMPPFAMRYTLYHEWILRQNAAVLVSEKCTLMLFDVPTCCCIAVYACTQKQRYFTPCWKKFYNSKILERWLKSQCKHHVCRAGNMSACTDRCRTPFYNVFSWVRWCSSCVETSRLRMSFSADVMIFLCFLDAVAYVAELF